MYTFHAFVIMSYHKYFFGGLKIQTGVLRKKESKNFMKLIDRFTERCLKYSH